jgi:hypothetical protein
MVVACPQLSAVSPTAYLACVGGVHTGCKNRKYNDPVMMLELACNFFDL